MDIELTDLNEKLMQKNEAKESSVETGVPKKDIHIPTMAANVRTVRFNGYRSHVDSKVTNKLNNRKYTLLNMVPMVLYN